MLTFAYNLKGHSSSDYKISFSNVHNADTFIWKQVSNFYLFLTYSFCDLADTSLLPSAKVSYHTRQLWVGIHHFSFHLDTQIVFPFSIGSEFPLSQNNRINLASPNLTVVLRIPLCHRNSNIFHDFLTPL